MPDSEIVRELLLKWDEDTAATPEELRGPYMKRPDHGELLQAVRNAIADLRAVLPFVAPSAAVSIDFDRTSPPAFRAPSAAETLLDSAHHLQGSSR